MVVEYIGIAWKHRTGGYGSGSYLPLLHGILVDGELASVPTAAPESAHYGQAVFVVDCSW